MILEPKSIENTAKEIHGKLEFYYKMWCDLQEVAKSNGYELDEKSAKIRPYGKEKK